MKNIILKLLLVSIMLNLLVPITFSTVAEANFEGHTVKCLVDVPSDDDSGSSGETGGLGGDWLAQGTVANKTAQGMWDWWKKKGFGGVQLAGILGVVDIEGGFSIPDRAQGTTGNLGLASNVEPIGGGGGHYQFTPYTKYAPMGDKKWLDSDKQNQFVWDSEVKSAKWLPDFLKTTTPEVSAKMFSDKYERPAHFDTRKADSAKKAYISFGGKDILPDSDLALSGGTAETGSEEYQKAKTAEYCGSSSKNGGNDGNIIKTGRKLLGYFTYLQVHGEHYIGSVDNPKKDGVTDCSGFIWLVLMQSGYKAPEDMQWFTGSMEADAKGENKWLKEISKNEAGEGDIVIVNTGGGAGSNGHTAFLTEKWKSEPDVSNTTGIIQQGGEGGSVNESTFSASFLSLLQKDHSITFARPMKK